MRANWPFLLVLNNAKRPVINSPWYFEDIVRMAISVSYLTRKWHKKRNVCAQQHFPLSFWQNLSFILIKKLYTWYNMIKFFLENHPQIKTKVMIRRLIILDSLFRRIFIKEMFFHCSLPFYLIILFRCFLNRVRLERILYILDRHKI